MVQPLRYVSAALGHAVWWLGYRVEPSGARSGRGAGDGEEMPTARVRVGGKDRRSGPRDEGEDR